MNMHICTFIFISCAAKPRSHHLAMSMNVAKPASKYMIRKCITIPWRAAKGRKNEAKGNQRGTRRERKGAKWKHKCKTHPKCQNTFENLSIFGKSKNKGKIEFLFYYLY